MSYCARKPRGDEFSNFPATADGAKAVATPVDIASLSDIKDWVEKSIQKFGKIDCVVANGKSTYQLFYHIDRHRGKRGLMISNGIASPLLQEPTQEHWEKSFQADIMGLVNLLETTEKHLVDSVKAGGSPSVVVITSLAGYMLVLPNVGSPYNTFTRAKAVIAKDYARKFAPLGIRINTLALGMIETPNITHPDGTVEWSSFQTFKKENPDFLRTLEEQIPLKRAGQCDEIANAVIFLASRVSSYICGATIPIDGSLSVSLL